MKKDFRNFSRFAGKRRQDDGCVSPAVKSQPRRGFLGNGLSRTAMMFKIATIGGVKLSVTQLNRIKDINPRRLESVYDEVLRIGDATNAKFAISLLLK